MRRNFEESKKRLTHELKACYSSLACLTIDRRNSDESFGWGVEIRQFGSGVFGGLTIIIGNKLKLHRKNLESVEIWDSECVSASVIVENWIENC